MKILEGLEPKNVMKYFEDISKVPRRSGEMENIIKYLNDYANEKKLECINDSANNVIIKKPATAGFENSPVVILQCHMDMVCVQTSDSNKDFAKEGIDIYVEGEYIAAKNTTLGADNGAALALMLALLDDEKVEHPALECVFTSDEETGLFGAQGLDVNNLKGRIMLNLDSGNEDEITVGCAGGVCTEIEISVNRENFSGKTWEISLTGLEGGHSGIDANKGFGNANTILGRVLFEISEAVDLRIIEISGGSADNAIPTDAKAVISVNDENKLADICKKYDAILKQEYGYKDKNIRLNYKKVDENQLPLDEEGTKKTILFLDMVPNGVIKMSPTIDNFVQTSVNLGIIKSENNKVLFTQAIRSSVKSEKRMLANKIRHLVEYLGGTIKFNGDYPGWEYAKESKLRDVAEKVYKTVYHKDPKIVTIHAGLECGYFVDKIPNLDCASFAFVIDNEHTVKERLQISSVQRTWDLVCGILKDFK